MSNHYVKSKKKGENIAVGENAAMSASINMLAEIIANQIIKKLLQDEHTHRAYHAGLLLHL